METTWKWKAKNTSGNGHRESMRAESEQGGEGSDGHTEWATKLADQRETHAWFLELPWKKCFSSVRASGQKKYFVALSFELKLLKWFHNFFSLSARCQKWENSWAGGQANKYWFAPKQRPCQNYWPTLIGRDALNLNEMNSRSTNGFGIMWGSDQSD